MKIRVNGLTIKSDIEQRYFIRKLLICAIVALLYGATLFLGEELLNGESAFAYFTYWKSFAYFGIHSMIKGVVPFVVLFLIWTIFDVFRKKSNCEDQTQSRCEQWVMIAGLVLMSLPCYFAYDHGIISYDAGENIAEAAGVASPHCLNISCTDAVSEDASDKGKEKSSVHRSLSGPCLYSESRRCPSADDLLQPTASCRGGIPAIWQRREDR